MGLRVVTQARHTALISRATVKERLSIAPSDTSKDAVLDSLIAAASSSIAKALGYDLARQTYLEDHLGTGDYDLLLSRFPIDRDQLVITLDGEAVTDFDIQEARTGHLWRAAAWTKQTRPLWSFSFPAGWIVPDALRTWAASLVFKTGEWVRPTDSLSPLLFECTTPGTTSGGEPAWPGTPGGTIASGSATFTARNAPALPAVVSDFCWLVVQAHFFALLRSPDLASLTADGVSQSFFSQSSGGMSGGLPAGLESRLSALRASL